MASRLGALLIALGLAAPVSADTVWLKPTANKTAIQSSLGQVRIFSLPTPPARPAGAPPPVVDYLRGRIISLTRDAQGKTTQIELEAWSRPPGAQASDAITIAPAFFINITDIAAIDLEVDSILDFELMFSDRYKLPTAGPATKPKWERMFGAALSPLLENPAGGTVGHVDLDLDGARPKAENPSPPAGVTYPGWVLKYLVDRPPVAAATSSQTDLTQPVYSSPGRPGVHSDPKRLVNDLGSASADPIAESDMFDPILINVGTQQACHELLIGLARLPYFETFPRDPTKELTHREFDRCSREAIRFLCRLAMIKAKPLFRNGNPVTLSGTDLFERHYHDAGVAAREAIIQALEAAGPGMLSPGDFNPAMKARLQQEIDAIRAKKPDSDEAEQYEQRYRILLVDNAAAPPSRLAKEAELAVSPSALAEVALSILVDAPEWWAIHSRLKLGPTDTVMAPGRRFQRDPNAELPDIDRLTSAVVDLATPQKDPDTDEPYPDPRREDSLVKPNAVDPGSAYSRVRQELAPLMLIRFLRPGVPSPEVAQMEARAGAADANQSLSAMDQKQRDALKQRLDQSAHVFAEELGHSLTESDPARREASRVALQTAMMVPGDPIMTRRMVEDLLSAASAQNQREDLEPNARAEVGPDAPAPTWSNVPNAMDEQTIQDRRAARQHIISRRRHAIRVLMILARLDSDGNRDPERRVGRMVLERLADIREAAANGRASQGELNMLGIFRELRENKETNLRREARDLDTRISREMDSRRDEVEAELERLRGLLQSAVSDRQRRDLDGRLRDCERRRERLRRLSGK